MTGDRHHGHAKPVEDAQVRIEVAIELLIEPVEVDIERVRVLHRELAHAQQAALGTRLVAELLADVVRHLVDKSIVDSDPEIVAALKTTLPLGPS